MLARHEYAAWDEQQRELAEQALQDGVASETARHLSAFREAVLRERASQATLLHDLFGNPFSTRRPIAPTLLTWRDGLIKVLAEQAYQDRLLPSGQLDPERLVVLADALEEAGADAALVAHLREPCSHYRGCWAVDLLTGRT
jgi:hypothetical protein